MLDLETSGLDEQAHEILEIGAIKLNGDTEIARYHTFVRPTQDVPADILTLTGIDLGDLHTAPAIDEVLPQFLHFIDGETIVGHNVGFDMGFLRRACDHNGYELSCKPDALDTLVLARCLEPTERDYGLAEVANRHGYSPAEVHRALADTETTVGILTAFAERAQELPYATLQQVAQLAGLFSVAAADWFMEQAQQRYALVGDTLPQQCQSIRGLVFRKEQEDSGDRGVEVEEEASGSDPLSFLQDQGPLAKVLPGFEVRPGQQQMVSAVANALQGDQHLLVEAGTGTGKSLAYLIPAALYALANDARVMISTHTIALQEQIQARDFPTLREVLPVPVNLTVFKGRTHYVCMRKLYSDVGSLDFATSREEIVAYMGFLVWLTETSSGDREELGLSGKGMDVWPRIQSETETCINKRCPFFKPCYYFRARTKAYESDLVVTNHSLIFSDLKADHRVLPFYDKLILDEAHHLEEEATKHLGLETHLRHVQALFARIVRDNQRQGVLPELLQRFQSIPGPSTQAVIAWIQDLIHRTGAFRLQMEDTFLLLSDFVPKEKAEFRLTPDIQNHPRWQSFLSAIDTLSEQWSDLSDVLSKFLEAAEDETDEDLAGRMLDAVGFFPEIEKNVTILCQTPDFDDDWVTWIEVRKSGSRWWPSLHRAPIDVAPLLEERIFNTKSTVVMTSATLSVNGSFEFTKSQLGLRGPDEDGRLATATVESPFDLSRQALLCIPKDVPDLAPLSDAEAATWLSDSLYQLAKASDGRVMALFTSHSMLRATATALRAPLASAGYRTLAQGIDGNRNQLLTTFRNHPNSILLGAQTFWEGIDLPGDQLRTLVIVRLPFAPPTHPVTVARHQRLEEQGKSSFRYSSLPQAVVRFRQGFGRLIRSTTDKGVVVVYDKRIVTARYGSTFIQSISGLRPYIDTEERIVNRVAQFFSTPQ